VREWEWEVEIVPDDEGEAAGVMRIWAKVELSMEGRPVWHRVSKGVVKWRQTACPAVSGVVIRSGRAWQPLAILYAS
jgi:hypothetical protein